ncbi:MAG: branched-chain amino acid ABC transporter permease [Dethiobacter sp.]|nr:branched-chain amino acid ABC transporter permease [Dethiobacter sp.]
MIRQFIQKNWFYLLVLLFALVFPVFSPSRYVFHIVIYCCIFSIATLSFNLILGYTGQASLAHGGFFGIGAYAVALMTLKGGLNFWLALLLASLISAFIGFLIGLPTLRTKGSYFAISTLCFGVIVYIVAGAWIGFTGGYTGLRRIPPPTPITLPLVGQISFTTPTAQYYLVLAFLLFTLWAMHRIVFSLQGYSFIAIRNNENLAEAVGINTFKNKLLSFVVSNFFVGMAGGLYVGIMRTVDPTTASYTTTFNYLIFLLIGGVATLAGPVIGAFGVFALLEYLHALGHYRMVLFGALLVVVIIYLPRGVMGGLTTLRAKVDVYYQQRKDGAQRAIKG